MFKQMRIRFLCLAVFLISMPVVGQAAPQTPRTSNAAHLSAATIRMVNATNWAFFNYKPRPLSQWNDYALNRACLAVAMATQPIPSDGHYKFSQRVIDKIALRYFNRKIGNHEYSSEENSDGYLNGFYTGEASMDENNNGFVQSSHMMDVNTCRVIEYGWNDEHDKTSPSAIFTLKRKTPNSNWYIVDYKNVWH